MAVVKVSPGSQSAATGSVPGTLVAKYNDLAAKFNALLAKMDADFADVTNASTDYAATIGDADTISYRGGGTPT